MNSTNAPNFRVLVVDDNRAIHDDIRKILSPSDQDALLARDEALLFDRPSPTRIGFDIDSASQGQEGLACLQQALAAGRPYALAFVDIRMPPGWDGIETVGHLWSADPDLQVVICTAYSDYSWRDIEAKLGQSHNLLILKKPFDNIEVVQLAHALTAKWSAMRQLRDRMQVLDQLVEQRTAALRLAHGKLQDELQQRIQAEDAFRVIFETSPVAIAICDQDGRLLDVNRSFETDCGLTGEQLTGHDTPGLWRALHISGAEEFQRQALACHSLDGVEVAFEHPQNGSCTGLLWIRKPLIGGQPRMLMFLLDITDRKRMERDIEHARAEAEKAALAKSEFLAHMSHEIRTPLNGVLGLATLMEEDNLSPESRRNVEAIRSAGQTLLRVVGNVLDFSKVESGHLELERIPFDLRDCLEQSAALFRTAASQKGVELRVNMAPRLPARVIGDVARLQQVLFNLLSNAIKFTGKGSVELGAAHSAAAAAPGQCPLRIWVADTGIGIPEDRFDRLFLPFSQGDSATNRRYGGTGLGLVISKRIVEAMGGTIQVQSRAAEGTTFELLLTMETAAGPERTAQASVLQDLHALRVLVAEDNSINQMVITRMLKRLGVSADLAVDGDEAVRRAEDSPYDLVLMDVQMPGKDGLEATQMIRSAGGRNSRIPVLALTAHASSEEKRRCLAVGMDDFLTKPIGLVALREALERWGKPRS